MLIVWERKGPTLISVVLLSSPFWVAWLAVILNQQGGLSGAEGSAEGEVCVCLFVVLHSHFLSIFALLFYAFTFEILFCILHWIFILQNLWFYCSCLISPWQEEEGEGGVVFVCLRHFFYISYFTLVWGEEVYVWFDIYLFIFYLGMRRGGLGGRWDLRNRDIASSASGSQPSSPAPHSLK